MVTNSRYALSERKFEPSDPSSNAVEAQSPHTGLVWNLEEWDVHELSLTQNWLATLTAVPKGLGSNPGEGMDVCKCIVPLRQGDTLNSRRAARPHVRLVEGEERWETSGHPQGFLPLNWGGTEQNRTVTCVVLKTKAND
ncbi:uncharacterized protein TNCV_3139841 [Trichonephila clavipes]|nr:uncharacterized protein TNCV_3139841 [Trichonephila clavipes]